VQRFVGVVAEVDLGAVAEVLSAAEVVDSEVLEVVASGEEADDKKSCLNNSFNRIFKICTRILTGIL